MYMHTENINLHNERRTYTVPQIAQILGVSVRKAYYICENVESFKVMRLGKRCLRIQKESFDEWFESGGSVS